MGGGGDHIGKRHRIRINTGSNQAGDVSHINHQVSTDFIGDGTEAREVEHLRVSRETGDDHFRFVLNGKTFDFVVINQTGFRIQTVLHSVVGFAREVRRRTVGQVTAMRQTHAKHGVARLQQRQKHSAIGLRTGVRLDVGVVGTKHLTGTINRQLLNHINVLAAAVIALAGVPFGILVGQHRALSFNDRRGSVVLRGNQLDMGFLTLLFCRDGSLNFRVKRSDGVVFAKHEWAFSVTGFAGRPHSSRIRGLNHLRMAQPGVKVTSQSEAVRLSPEAHFR